MTETTNRCAAEMNGERCHYLSWHTGAHRSEHHDWPNGPVQHCIADTEHGACLRRPGHAGEHAWRTVTAQALDRGEAWRPREKLTTEDVRLPQPGEEWPPVPCGVLFVGPDGDHTICNVIASHIGSHQHLPVDLHQDAGEDKPELPKRKARTITFDDLRTLSRELVAEVSALEERVNERLVRLEESMGEREARPIRGLGEVERRMTALEARFGRLAEDKWRAVAEQPEPSPQVTVYGIDVSEWDRRLGTLEKRAELVVERVNRAEYRILRAIESLQAEQTEHARGTVADTCGAVGQWRPPTGADPVAVECTRLAGHEGGGEDRGMTWLALCADGSGEPWCTKRNGHDGECDQEPMAQVLGPSGRCRAVLLIGESGRYRCTLDQGHDGRHTEN